MRYPAIRLPRPSFRQSNKRFLHTLPHPPLPSPLTLQSSSPLIESYGDPSSSKSVRPDDFLFWPNFFSIEECRTLVQMALWKLDRVDSTLKRRRKGKSPSQSQDEGDELQKLFDREYGFQEGHYDSVIHNYRETLLSSLPPNPSSNLVSTISKLYSLLPDLPPSQLQSDQIPPEGTITHLLHLSPAGEILPHVDNLEASGKYICGVSLGGERIMRLRRKDRKDEGWDVRLGSGSVYLQRDSIRYEYEHSILPYSTEGSEWNGEKLNQGHRISIMIRDTPSKPAQL
ncbi:hypothetical protein I302_102363 [Kwoniella bestiolae CBS 10118]|uniref:Alpha-ketoglutarate-dependent dioxygenase AlkB-like domain-containing protein n=1 Tax=Kwoniella bestiolae CBS 10118 TaxID=1296100 RepID=A0A1B9GEU3_9TREE|nr:hypothetical protein I302_01055 [Kwoniella bestiolae CBS 10118]OCF29547.1 hypothetical protein I302_01055 [Kwoniella bestiolae CBS 10118]